MDAPLNPDPPQKPWIIQLLTDPNIQRWVERLVMAAIATYFGVKVNAIHSTVESAKDLSADTNQKQVAVIKGTKDLVIDRLGDNAPAAKALEATTQPTK